MSNLPDRVKNNGHKHMLIELWRKMDGHSANFNIKYKKIPILLQGPPQIFMKYSKKSAILQLVWKFLYKFYMPGLYETLT